MPGTRQAPDRSAQRARTRRSLVEAAVDLLREGRPVTVAEAATAAGVHRATAYRYFPTPEALHSAAALTATAPTPQQLVDGVGDDAFDLLDAVVHGFAGFAFADEALLRANLRNDIDRWATRDRDPAGAGTGEVDASDDRESRRFDYLAPVLTAVADRMPEDRLRRLRSALALVFGAEAVIVTRDVCRLDTGEATEVMRWAAATLLAAALTPEPS